MKVNNKALRKIISFALTMNILFTNLQIVYAQDNNDKSNVSTDSYVNPMYQELELDLTPIQSHISNKEKSINTFNSIEEAAGYMKDEMVKRASNISLTVNTSYYKGIHRDIYNLAVDESNATNSSEGDYLKSHFGGYNVTMSYTTEYVRLDYNVSYLSTYSQEEEVNKKVKTVLNSLNAYDLNEYEKIKVVHDYIVTNIDYDYTYSKHSAYNAIIENSTVCQGFSSLTYKMLKELGIGVRYISGVGNGGPHAWNIVRIKDLWYNIDNTWDENISNSSISYKYFLKNMNDFGDHTRNSEFLTDEFNKNYPMSDKSYIYIGSDENPVITASDKVLKVGDTFNEKTGVSASDKEDGDITSKIVVKENTVNTSKVGTYKVVYQVIDSDKNTVTKEIKVTVNNVFTNFTVNNIDSKTTIIKGKGISGSTVKAYVGTKQIGDTVTVNSSGNYSINIPAQSANTKIKVQINKSGYETASKTITVIGVKSGAKKSLTTDIYKYDAGKGNHLTYINGSGYSQYVYLNKSGNYAFTPSSWMIAAGLDVSMPKSSNGYTMTIDNNYIQMYNEANELLNNIISGKVAKSSIEGELNRIKNIKNKELEVENKSEVLTKATPTKTLTKDIYKYDIGKGKYLTYINGRGYSQYVYLNTSGNYAFTPSSWMVAAGLTVTMPTSSNGYTMKIDNPYITKYNDVVKQIESYI